MKWEKLLLSSAKEMCKHTWQCQANNLKAPVCLYEKALIESLLHSFLTNH